MRLRRPGDPRRRPSCSARPSARARRHPGHRRRPRPVRRLQLVRAARHRAPGRRATGPSGTEVTARGRVGKKAPSLLPLPRASRSAQSSPASPTAPSSPTRATSPPSWRAPFLAGEVDQVAAGLDPLPLRRDPGRRGPPAAASAAARDDEASRRPRPRRRRSRATPSSSPSAEKLLAELAPAALESEIFAALLEGAASFFTASSARWRRRPRTPTSWSAR